MAGSTVSLGEANESAEERFDMPGSHLLDWRRAALSHNTGAGGRPVVVEAGTEAVVVAVVGEIIAAGVVVAAAAGPAVVVPTSKAGHF